MSGLVVAAMAACLATARPADAFTFLSIGDWGGSAAKKLNPYMGQQTPEFVIAIGDNFYSRGVKGIEDSQFQTKFEDTFTAPSLKNVSWYVTSGNHDYYGGQAGIDAEIEYTNHSQRWEFPDYYHSKDIIAADGTKILVVATDTWRINGGDTFVKFDPQTERMALHSQAHVEEMYRSGNMLKSTYETLLEHFEEEDATDPIPWDPTKSHDKVQLDWVEATLMGSDADWKVVMGHFPIYSATTHEHGETPKLIKYLDPILHKAKADMYFSGHDHILQHTIREGVSYFGEPFCSNQKESSGPFLGITTCDSSLTLFARAEMTAAIPCAPHMRSDGAGSGAGAMKHTGVNKRYPGLQGSASAQYGFMVHEGNKTALTTTFVMDDGSRPYRCDSWCLCINATLGRSLMR